MTVTSRLGSLLVIAVAAALLPGPVSAAEHFDPCPTPSPYDCEAWVARHRSDADGVGYARDVAMSPTGDRVFVTGDYGPTFFSRHAVTIAYDARTGQRSWLATYDGGGNDIGWVVAASPDGTRVYVGGQSQGEDGYPQFLTVAYDAATGAELWVEKHRGIHDTLGQVWAIGVSPDGATVFVSGRSPERFQADHLTIAYDADSGDERWRAVTSGPIGGAETRALAVSPDGERVFITGSNWGQGTSLDYVTAAYDAASGDELWVMRYDESAGGDFGQDAVVSPDGGTVYVTGRSQDAARSYDYATIAYDAVTGQQRWLARYKGSGDNADWAYAIAADPAGERVYVTGRSRGDGTGDDYATVAYDAASGEQAWVARYHGPTVDGHDRARAIALSPDGSQVVVTGTSGGAPQWNTDIATVAYDAATGEQRWVTRYDGPARSDDQALAAAVHPDGSLVYAAGLSFGSADGGLSNLAQYVTLAYETGLAAGAPPAEPRPGVTARASSTPGGLPGDGGSGGIGGTAVSADGGTVAFHSSAGDLLESGNTPGSDVFAWDVAGGSLERVSVAGDGTPGDKPSFRPALSADGRYVVFDSQARNFDARLPEPPHDFGVFRHDRVTGATVLVSAAQDGEAANGRAHFPSVSAGGRYVAFHSTATNLVEDPEVGVQGGLREHVYVHDVQTGVTELISVSPDGQQGSAGSSRANISADGRYVAFHSRASNLVAGPPSVTAPDWQVFVRDRQTDQTELVSVDRDGNPVDGRFASISGDGRYVAFRDGDHRVLVRDLVRGVTEQVTVDSHGRQGAGQGAYPSLSADGRYVAFASRGADLAPGIDPGVWEIVVHDRLAGASEVASVGSDAAQSDGPSQNAAVSGDGRLVAFDSVATTLTPGDPGGVAQVLARDRGSALGTVGPVRVEREGDTVQVGGQATFSGVAVAEATRAGDPLAGARAAADARLHAAQVVYRPERADLFVRVQLESMREPALGEVGPAGRVYGLAFTAGGQRYQIRAAGHTPDDVGLFGCDGPVCEPVADLDGSLGERGPELVAGLPLALLGIGEGDTLADLRAFVSAGDTDLPGPDLDDLTLPDATLPQRSVTVRVQAGAATSVAPATLQSGAFTAVFDARDLPPDPLQIQVDVCLGGGCATTDAQG